MPFERYLQSQDGPSQNHYEYDTYGRLPPAPPRPMSLAPPPMHMAVRMPQPPEAVPYNNPRFQIPNFIYDLPTLAPGGGAEVFPTGLAASPWVSNCGFTPSFFEP